MCTELGYHKALYVVCVRDVLKIESSSSKVKNIIFNIILRRIYLKTFLVLHIKCISPILISIEGVTGSMFCATGLKTLINNY